MFDSQICSLASITFLVQFLGLAIVVIYRLSESGRLNHAGLLFGMTLMAISTICCLMLDASCGMTQGVTLVFVAVCTTIQTKSGEASPF
ncbi:MAG: hypothetical protein ACR2NP_13760 [Pirellulaceae bacterium]